MPASILLGRLDIQAVIRQAKAEGDLGAWVEPGPLVYALFFLVCVSLVLAGVSTVIDVRRNRSLDS